MGMAGGQEAAVNAPVTFHELAMLNVAMSNTRIAHGVKSDDYDKPEMPDVRRRFPDARDARIHRCTSCGAQKTTRQCPVPGCWTNLDMQHRKAVA